MLAPEVGYLVSVGSSGYYWNGVGELEFNNVTYSGFGELVSVSPIELSIGNPTKRLEVEIALLNKEMLKASMVDSGPVPIFVQFYDTSEGAMELLPFSFRGRLSEPQIIGRKLVMTVETDLIDLDRGFERLWNRANQLRRFPGDRGLDDQEKIADGRIQVRWPT